jgi:mono/diheme cytochrome c family protein
VRLPLLVGLAWILGDPDDGCLAAFEGAPPPVDQDRRLAQELWIRDCADCHGLAGGVDGGASAALDPRPPDLGDPCRPVQDQWVARVILDGAGSFNGNPAMRAHHELDARPEVLAALVEIVQGFRRPGPCVVEPREPVVTPDQRD